MTIHIAHMIYLMVSFFLVICSFIVLVWEDLVSRYIHKCSPAKFGYNFQWNGPCYVGIGPWIMCIWLSYINLLVGAFFIFTMIQSWREN